MQHDAIFFGSSPCAYQRRNEPRELRTVDAVEMLRLTWCCRRCGRQGLDSAEEDGAQVRNQHPRHRVQGKFFRACHSLSSPSQLPSLHAETWPWSPGSVKWRDVHGSLLGKQNMAQAHATAPADIFLNARCRASCDTGRFTLTRRDLDQLKTASPGDTNPRS